MTVTRRLAAILAADVVGFSRMMEADEARTLTALKGRRRDGLDPLVAKRQGRIFKTTCSGAAISSLDDAILDLDIIADCKDSTSLATSLHA